MTHKWGSYTADTIMISENKDNIEEANNVNSEHWQSSKLSRGNKVREEERHYDKKNRKRETQKRALNTLHFKYYIIQLDRATLQYTSV